jgi:hypothetical protein
MSPQARADIDHFNSIVPKRGNKKLVLPIESKMIEPALDAWRGNRLG